MKNKKEIIFNAAIANKNNKELENITCINGNKKQIIEFLNNEYKKRYLKNRFIDNIVFNLAYSNENELLDINNWCSINELVNGNIFILEDKK